MFDKIIAYSIQHKMVVGLLIVAWMAWGFYSLHQLPIDAIPDITNNQVQVITTSPTLATQEVEQFITTPVELALQNIQQLVEIRSISRFGLSVVTVVFEEEMDVYLARQLVGEYLKKAAEEIPPNLGTPEMAPISTGLGEIYQYVVRPKEGFENQYSPTDLRSIQDWIVKRQLSGLEGVVEVNTLGGFLKQYEVAINPNLLKSMNISIEEIYHALQQSNENTGGAYIEKNPNSYYIRSDGIIKSLSDIENIVVTVRGSTPILIKDLAKVQFGKAPRYGALTRNGEEVVGGTVMMLKGANSAAVTERIKERVAQIQKSLPEGVIIDPYLVRDKLISTAIGTVQTNLLEGGLIVIFILVLLLGNWRAGLIVASVIPLSMLFAVSMMNVLGISANLMSLGAIDFGLIVDGAVIIVEAIIHSLGIKFAGQRLNQKEMDEAVLASSMKIRNAAAFGEIIILMVYIPILALVGIEGTMFKPMAITVMLAICGALILSLTYVPMMAALVLNKNISNKITIADRIINFCQRLYQPVLRLALKFKMIFVLATIVLFGYSLFIFSRMGGEFIPTLEEGDFALHQILPPGSSLSQSVAISKLIQEKLLTEFPEVEDVVTKIGSAEIPTDPMSVETGDVMVIMKPKSEWTSAKTRPEMFAKMEEKLKVIPGIAYEFSQPIQMRFNELMTGSRADIAIKLYGQNLDLLYEKAKFAETIIRNIQGVGTTKVDQTLGMPQIVINFKYDKMAQYGLQVKQVNQVIRTAFAGEKAGTIYEGEKRFDLVIRLSKEYRDNIDDVQNLYIPLANGTQIPLMSVAEVALRDAPMQISRDNTNRGIVIGVNLGDTDVQTLVENIQKELETKVDLPPGYYFTYGGQFENLQAANARLLIAVPITLLLIFVLLFFTFGSFFQALLIFTAIPLSAIGGIWALQLRGMPFSISAGIGFIALFGVAVLNGIVLIGCFNQLKNEGMKDIQKRIIEGTKIRLRPVLMTATVASLGFLPMAVSISGGAEVQRPLATVVIGGLITATFLTLIILPILYSWLVTWQQGKSSGTSAVSSLLILLFCSFGSLSLSAQPRAISLDEALNLVLEKHPALQGATLRVQQTSRLQDLKYAPGLTEINYQGDGLFRENGQQVNQIGVLQNFQNPAVYRQQNAFQKESLKQVQLEKQLVAKQLGLQVQRLFYNLQHRKALAQLYEDLIRNQQQYVTIAQAQVNAGEENQLGLLRMETVSTEYQLLVEQTQLEIANLEKRFSLLLGTEERLTSDGTLQLLTYESQDTIHTLSAQLAQQNIQLERATADLMKAGLKPRFNLGYALQRFVDGGWLSGLQVGVKISLFNQPAKQKVQAQELQASVAAANYAREKLANQEQLLIYENAIKLYAKGAAYYQDQLTRVNPEMERIAQLNYAAGNLSYVELQNILQRIASHQKQYLEQVLAHNEAVLQYQFLSNP